MANKSNTFLTSVKKPNNINPLIGISEIKTEKAFLFSFEFFDREHPLFNLGSHETKPIATNGEWFIALLDILKQASCLKITDFKNKYDLHPLERDNSNIKEKDLTDQREYWSFDVTKGSRVIGFKIDNRFYIQWLDRHHNHCNFPGYGKQNYYCRPLSEAEKLHNENEELKEQNQKLIEDNEMLCNMCDNCPSKIKNL